MKIENRANITNYRNTLIGFAANTIARQSSSAPDKAERLSAVHYGMDTNEYRKSLADSEFKR